MLVQFSIKNFRTFKEKTTLSLVASNYDKETREVDNVNYDSQFKLRLLKSAVVYGANASGKSKFFEALAFMKDIITNRFLDNIHSIGVIPFKLDQESLNAPTEFEVIFILNEIMYRYGFEADKKQIISEWLYYKPKTKEIELFYRDGQNFETHTRNFSKGNLVIKQGLVRDNTLLLFVAAQFNDETSIKVIDWFRDIEVLYGLDERTFRYKTIQKIEHDQGKNKILDLIKVADLGIEDIQYDDAHNSDFWWDDFNDGSNLFSIHTVYNTEKKYLRKAKFSITEDESNGTRKFLYLSGTIIDALEKGSILFIDELGTALHPNLVYKIVELFNSKITNPNNAQLVFNTHNTNLLDTGLFRRDQIWFTNKDKYGAAQLYSLADFKSKKVRKNESFEDNYIRGKYGAVPFLGFFDNLNKIFLEYENAKQKS